MIKLNKDWTDILIYKSNFDYSTVSSTYSITIVNDFSKEKYQFPFILNYENDMVVNIGLTGASFSVGGFYTLNILLNDDLQYKERCYIKDFTIDNGFLYDDSDNDIIFYDGDE